MEFCHSKTKLNFATKLLAYPTYQTCLLAFAYLAYVASLPMLKWHTVVLQGCSTLIMSFVEMMKISKITFFKQPIFVKENIKYFGIFKNIYIF
jgi:hypothetical protein